MTTLVLNEQNHHPITDLFVYMSVDDDGNEGIIASRQDGHWTPLVVTSLDLASRFEPVVRDIAAISNKRVRLVQFERGVTLKEF